MRIILTEEIEEKRAFSRAMRCPHCDSNRYEIHHQVETAQWWVSCGECSFEGQIAPTRALAIRHWRNT